MNCFLEHLQRRGAFGSLRFNQLLDLFDDRSYSHKESIEQELQKRKNCKLRHHAAVRLLRLTARRRSSCAAMCRPTVWVTPC
jgi:HPt (histidine-containing phosphotransfer) domain-containing protein